MTSYDSLDAMRPAVEAGFGSALTEAKWEELTRGWGPHSDYDHNDVQHLVKEARSRFPEIANRVTADSQRKRQIEFEHDLMPVVAEARLLLQPSQVEDELLEIFEEASASGSHWLPGLSPDTRSLAVFGFVLERALVADAESRVLGDRSSAYPEVRSWAQRFASQVEWLVLASEAVAKKHRKPLAEALDHVLRTIGVPQDRFLVHVLADWRKNMQKELLSVQSQTRQTENRRRRLLEKLDKHIRVIAIGDVLGWKESEHWAMRYEQYRKLNDTRYPIANSPQALRLLWKRARDQIRRNLEDSGLDEEDCVSAGLRAD